MKVNFPENIANKRDSIMPLSKQTLWKETGIRSELQNCSNIDKIPTVKPEWKWHKNVIKTVLAKETKHDGHIPVRKSQRKSMGNNERYEKHLFRRLGWRWKGASKE